jgi:LTXXQ motif family protein
MNRKAYQGVFPVRLIVVAVSVLSVVFFAGPNLSSAATGKKKSPAVEKTSAVDRAEARIKQLQAALKITDAQKELWTNLTQVMREDAKEMDTLTEGRYEKSKTMNAVEQLKFHSQITEARATQMKNFIPPFEALYNSLSDDQKKITDTIFRTGKHGKHKIQ